VIEALISSKMRVKLLMKFFINQSNKAYLRGLSEEFGESTNGIRLELNKFESSGFLTSFTSGNKKFYQANDRHPLFKNIHQILLKTTGIEYALDYVLQRIGDLEKVYLVGSFSKGIESGIIDFVLVGNNLNINFLMEQIEKVEKKIEKKIRFVIYDKSKFDLSQLQYENLHPLLLWSKDK
jgi:hypothetical protein